MCGIGHVKLLGMEGRPKREKAALCGCGLLENVADLAVQRCRRTRRDPSPSNERRRKAARSWVRVKIITPPYIRMAGAVKSAAPPNAAIKVGRPGERPEPPGMPVSRHEGLARP